MKKGLVFTFVLSLLMSLCVSNVFAEEKYDSEAKALIEKVIPGIGDKNAEKVVQFLNKLQEPKSGSKYLVEDNWQQMSVYGQEFLINLFKEVGQLMKDYPDAKKKDIFGNVISTLSKGEAPTKDSATVSKITTEKFAALSEKDKAYVLDSYTMISSAVANAEQSAIFLSNEDKTVTDKEKNNANINEAVKLFQKILPKKQATDTIIKALNEQVYPINGSKYLVEDTWQQMSVYGQEYLLSLLETTRKTILSYPDAKVKDVIDNIIMTLSEGKAPTKDSATVNSEMIEKFKALSKEDQANVLSAYNLITTVALKLW